MIYRNDLEVYRAIAAIFVYLFHCKIVKLKGGYIGVDYFFVLSGYLFLQKFSKTKSTWDTFKFFYIKCLRLTPFSHLLLFSICYNFNLVYNNNPLVLLNDIKSALLFYSNYHFYNQNTNYFNKGEDVSLLLHYWYLSVEIQFCALASLSLLLSIPIRFLFYRSIILFSFIFNLIYSVKNSSYCYFSTFSRLWQILISYYTTNIKLRILYKIPHYCLIIFISVIYNSNINYPGFYSIIPTLLFYLIIIQNKEYSLQNSKVLKLLGTVSYPFYLIHYLLLELYDHGIFEEVCIFISTIGLSYIVHYHFNVYFKQPNIFNTLIIIMYVFLIYFSLIFIKININKVIKGSIYSKNVHPSLFIGFTPLLQIIDNEKCKTKYNNKHNYFLLIGDSHMSQWIPVFINISKKINCLILFKWASRTHLLKNSYIKFLLFTKNYNNTNVRFIFLSFFTTKLIQINIEIHILNIILVLKKLSPNVYMVEDNPSHNKSLSYCLRNNKNNNCYGILHINSTYYSYYRVKSILRDKYISFSNIYKNKKIIPYIYNNILIYIDNNHLSVDFALNLFHFFYNKLKWHKASKINNICRLYYT